MSITFGYKPVNERPPKWATHMIQTDEQPEIWWFAHKHENAYFVFEEDDLSPSLKDAHCMFTEHCIIFGGIYQVFPDQFRKYTEIQAARL